MLPKVVPWNPLASLEVVLEASDDGIKVCSQFRPHIEGERDRGRDARQVAQEVWIDSDSKFALLVVNGPYLPSYVGLFPPPRQWSDHSRYWGTTVGIGGHMSCH